MKPHQYRATRSLVVVYFALLTACQVPDATLQSSASPEQSQCRSDWTYSACDEASLLKEAELLLSNGKYQEAAWIYSHLGNTQRANKILADLESILRSPHQSDTKLGGGISTTFLLTYPSGVKAVFKPDRADPYCPECTAGREVAAYVIDSVFGFDLIPLTIHRSVELNSVSCRYHDTGGHESYQCPTLYGSVMYFVDSTQEAGDVGRGRRDKPDRMHLLDAIIGNSDRHPGNWLVSTAGRGTSAIDHNRTFRYTKPFYQEWHNSCWEDDLDLISDPQRLAPIVDRYRGSSEESLRSILGAYLTGNDIEQFLKFRESILERFEHNVRAGNNDKSLPYTVCPTSCILDGEEICRYLEDSGDALDNVSASYIPLDPATGRRLYHSSSEDKLLDSFVEVIVDEETGITYKMNVKSYQTFVQATEAPGNRDNCSLNARAPDPDMADYQRCKFDWRVAAAENNYEWHVVTASKPGYKWYEGSNRSNSENTIFGTKACAAYDVGRDGIAADSSIDLISTFYWLERDAPESIRRANCDIPLDGEHYGKHYNSSWTPAENWTPHKPWPDPVAQTANEDEPAECRRAMSLYVWSYYDVREAMELWQWIQQACLEGSSTEHAAN